ncbi:MAG: hypothetical protein AB8F78_05105 [Saprospiraceae bacterium]
MNDTLIPEKKTPAKKTPADETPQATLDVRAKYAEVIGRDVANSKKNDVEWMQSKIDEALACE